jgi:hypothetical protein
MELEINQGVHDQKKTKSSSSSLTAHDGIHGHGRALHATISNEGQEKILQLARRLTKQSLSEHHGQEALPNPFIGASDPKLDPQSDLFDAAHWTRIVLQLASDGPGGSSKRRAGVSFRNLSVLGHGNPVAYQQTFASAILRPINLASSLLSHKRNTIQILKGHDGLVRSGEMLLVLGRPGRLGEHYLYLGDSC